MARTASRVAFKLPQSSQKSSIGKGGLWRSHIPKNVGMLSRQSDYFMAGENVCDLAKE